MAFRARLIACLIATEIALSGSGIDSSRDCSRVDRVLVEALINLLLVSVLTPIANAISPSGSGVDCSRLDRVLSLKLKIARI